MNRLFAFILIVGALHAHAEDRRANVLAASRLFPTVLKFLEQSPRFQSLNAEEKSVFTKVRQLTENEEIPVVFGADPEHFLVNPGEPPRWMRTPVNAAGEIEVNLKLLNSPEVDPTLPLLLKTLFHEWAHKTGVTDWGLRDRVAQFVETETLPFVRTVQLSEGSRLTLFSIPADLFGGELVETSVNRPQPTNVLLLERNGAVEDATEALLQSMERASTLTRSLFGEANRLAFMMLESFMKMGTQQLGAMAMAMGFDAGEVLQKLDAALKAPLKQMRVFEMQDVETVEDTAGTLVRVKAIWQTAHKEKTELPIKFDGMQFMDSLPIPVSISMHVPHQAGAPLEEKDFTVSVRPNADLMAEAKVQTIQRDQDQRISRLVIAVESPERPRQVSLSALYDGGTRLIAAKEIEPGRAGRWNAVFELPWRFLPHGTLVAESVLVGTNKMIYLDRLVELRSTEDAPARSADGNAIVEGSAGIWGLDDKYAPVFLNQPKLEVPIILGVKALMAHPLPQKEKSELGVFVDAEELPVEFELVHEARVREVRLQYRRMALVSTSVLSEDQKRRGESVPDFLDVTWGGEKVKLILGGDGVTKSDLFEVVSVPAEKIFRAETAKGTQRVRTSFSVPFIPAGPLKDSTQGHIPPLFTPVALEVVLDDGQTLIHEFGQAVPENFCEFKLHMN